MTTGLYHAFAQVTRGKYYVLVAAWSKSQSALLAEVEKRLSQQYWAFP